MVFMVKFPKMPFWESSIFLEVVWLRFWLYYIGLNANLNFIKDCKLTVSHKKILLKKKIIKTTISIYSKCISWTDLIPNHMQDIDFTQNLQTSYISAHIQVNLGVGKK